MTLPDERTRAVTKTRAFLRALLRPDLTPKVPRWIRDEAYACLRHYPGVLEINAAAEGKGSRSFSTANSIEAGLAEDTYYKRLQERLK
jgi:hypothetical protein